MSVERLKQVMHRLRDPQSGCPWDLTQTLKSIAPYVIEETYELVEALETGDTRSIKEELGDLLFQVVFLAEVGRQDGVFDLDSVADAVAAKMIERHPHVFSDRVAATPEAVAANWEADKAAKRAAQAADGRHSLLDHISTALPAMTRAVKLQGRAARGGFDWANIAPVLDKMQEEIAELTAEINAGGDAATRQDRMEDELGDVLFATVNLARKLNIDPENALRRTNRKFDRRFRGIESHLARQGRQMTDASLDEMEELWRTIKAAENPSC